MTESRPADYCPLLMEGWQLLMEGWQSKAAFVIQCRPETDIEGGRFEGRIEHIASYKAIKFHSLDELMAYIARVLAEVRSIEQP